MPIAWCSGMPWHPDTLHNWAECTEIHPWLRSRRQGSVVSEAPANEVHVNRSNASTISSSTLGDDLLASLQNGGEGTGISGPSISQVGNLGSVGSQVGHGLGQKYGLPLGIVRFERKEGASSQARAIRHAMHRFNGNGTNRRDGGDIHASLNNSARGQGFLDHERRSGHYPEHTSSSGNDSGTIKANGIGNGLVRRDGRTRALVYGFL